LSRELRTRAPFFRKLIRDSFPTDRGARIFDLGCGYGALLYFAREAGYRNIAGVDISAEQVATATRLGIEGVAQGDLFATLCSLEDESQDAVVTFDVIEHLRKDEVLIVVDEIFRTLRKGGRWIVHVPNGASPFFGLIFFGDFTHEVAFTRSSLEQLALTRGYQQVVCIEDAPIPHGILSSLRWICWKIIRFLMRARLAVETGSIDPNCILTQNFVAVAKK
jgi:2-polyprenyl-3-methyl-5-hydroxy-6-metoxy-1,4-benzoquinol methylase